MATISMTEELPESPLVTVGSLSNLHDELGDVDVDDIDDIDGIDAAIHDADQADTHDDDIDNLHDQDNLNNNNNNYHNEHDNDHHDLEDDLEGLCAVCGVGDDGRALCHFRPSIDTPEEVFLHVFCGKTAGILPHINRPDLEILTKAGVKNKHGTGVSVTLALQKCRSARVNDPSNREQEYYLSREFERIYGQIAKDPSNSTSPDNENEVDQEVPNPIVTPSSDSTTASLEEGTVGTTSVVAAATAAAADSPLDDEDLPPHKKLKKTSPYELEMERLQQVCDRCCGVGYSLVRGVEGAEDMEDPTLCSQQQVDHVRVIVITKERQQCMEDMSKLLLGDQFGQSVVSFPSFAYQVINAWNAFTVKFQEVVTWADKFNLLLGFTDCLKEHDVWITDHEQGWGGEQMVRQLALSWKLVLQHSDDELDIDPEYTRPGIVALLEHFQEAVESVEPHTPEEKMTFSFK